VTHLGDPWATSFLAAPGGTQLAYHTLMPLPGLLMTPVTLLFGPSVSYNLLSIACPGLLCYAMYRAARLWLPTGFGAIAAGAFFGLSSNVAWRSWYQVNLALGALLLPLTLAAAVLLRRTPGRRRAAILGLVLGAALLTDQESSVLAGILAGLVLIPWLVRPPGARRAARAERYGGGLVGQSHHRNVADRRDADRPAGPGRADRGRPFALGRGGRSVWYPRWPAGGRQSVSAGEHGPGHRGRPSARRRLRIPDPLHDPGRDRQAPLLQCPAEASGGPAAEHTRTAQCGAAQCAG
jgi:hypothetical protein